MLAFAPKTFALWVVIVLAAVQLCGALFARIDTNAALTAMAEPKPLGRVLLWSLVLYIYNGDDENDITSPNIPRDARIYRCRDRANFVLLQDGIPFIVAVGVALHLRTAARPA